LPEESLSACRLLGQRLHAFMGGGAGLGMLGEFSRVGGDLQVRVRYERHAARG
jgi:hypothetical protein